MSALLIAEIRKRFRLVEKSLGERAKRHWVGAEAEAIGRGGVAWVAKATGMAISTVRIGRDELRALAGSPAAALEPGRERRRGGGRKQLKAKDPELLAKLTQLVTASSRGDPESPLQWTTYSLRHLENVLTKSGHPASHVTIRLLLRELGFSLQRNAKVKEGSAHPDREAQFRFINETADSFLSRGLPVISVDAKKKEFLGQRASPGREWTPKGEPIKVMSHDFVSAKDPVAIPYGIYDVGKNLGFVNVGANHNTPTFAARSIAKWWRRMGAQLYPSARELFITADAGGSNSPKHRLFKVELQKLADETGLTIHVSHFPPGTSKWNKIEHRLFSVITMNWRGRPLTSYEVIISLIANARTKTGLSVVAELDTTTFPLGTTASKQALAALSLERNAFHGEWNYTLKPRTEEQQRAASTQPVRGAVISHETRRAHWLELSRKHNASGLSLKKFCERENLNYVAFKQARRKHVGVKTLAESRRYWTDIFEQQRKSGLSVSDFCTKHRIRRGTFAATKRRMIQRAQRSED